MTLLRILLIEHSGAAKQQLESLLADQQPSDLELTHAESASAGQQLAESADFDVALVGLDAPIGRGIQTIAELNRSAPHLPIIGWSASQQPELVSAAINAGAQDCIAPTELDPRQLLRAIRLARERTARLSARHEDYLMYQALAEHSLVGVYVIQGGLFRYVNPSLAEIFGYHVEELTGQLGPGVLVHPDDRALVEGNIRRRLEGEVESLHYEFRGLRKDGSAINCEVLGSRLEIDGGPAVIGTLLDITKRERAERELITLSRAVKHSASVIMITDTDGVIEYVNPKFAEVTGYPVEQAVGQHVRLLRSPETPASTYPQLWDTILSGRDWKGLFRNKKRNGELYWALATISPIQDEAGVIQQFIAVQEDVTDQVNAEFTLRKQAADLTLLNSVNSLIHSGQDFGTIARHLTDQVKLNFECENASLYLVNPEGDRLDMVQMAVDPQVISQVEAAIQSKLPVVSILLEQAELHREALSRGRPKLIRDPKLVQALLAEHTESAVLRQAVPLIANLLNIKSAINVPLQHEGKPIGLLAVTSSKELGQAELERLSALAGPITVAIIRKQAEDRNRQLTEELEERVKARTAQLELANRELESFSYSVSHDLRAPLRSIDGFSQALLEEHAGQLDQAGRDHLTRVRNATSRMSDLIDDLLNLSRVARAELRRAPVDLSELARTVADDLSQSDPDRSVDWKIEFGLSAHGDPTLLRAVMENLLGNAWKFTSRQPEPRIEFGTLEAEGEQAFFVRDNGAGFNMDYADKLFGTFQRLHSDREYPGTGVGLASVQRVIHRHGGRIWAEGQVDRGATFYFTLPSS